MNELTDERLAELRAIAEAATPGPWHWDKSKYHEDPYGFHQDDQPLMSSHDGQWSEVLGSSGYDASSTEASSEDRAHIAAFDPPTVLALLDRLDAVLKLHHAVDCEPSETICAGCSTLRGAGSSARYFPYIEYPCPTVLAARGER